MVLFSHLHVAGSNHPMMDGNDASNSMDSLWWSRFICAPQPKEQMSPCLRVRSFIEQPLMETSPRKLHILQFQDPGEGEKIRSFKQVKHRSSKQHFLKSLDSPLAVYTPIICPPTCVTACYFHHHYVLTPPGLWDMIVEELWRLTLQVSNNSQSSKSLL